MRSTGTTFLLACCLVVSQTSSLRAEELSIQQRRMLLADANELYQRATSADAADRRSLAAAAAEKYELLVDSKITNAKLYFNLANAYHKSGQFGRAIANYHRAIQIDPTNSRYRINLDHTRELIQSKANNQPATLTDPRGMVDSASEWLSRHVDPKSALIVALSAWSAFWASLLIRSMFNAFPWKSAMAVALCVFLPAAGALLLVHRGAKDRGSFAIVVEPSVELRSGDGSQFPSTARLADAEGTSVTVLQQRGKWTNIQAASGQIGWLPTAAIEVI